MFTLATILLAAASHMAIVTASPTPTNAVTQEASASCGTIPTNMAFGLGGALDATPMFSKNPPSYITITVVNKAGVDITTSQALSASASPLISGAPWSGVISKDASATIVAPTGWAGMIAINESPKEIKGDESIIEGAFLMQKNVTDRFAILDIDVSYVSGFSLPIDCYCQKDNTHLSGCKESLWAKGSCPNGSDNGAGSCINPNKNKKDATDAADFFKPCAGQAYTFPYDHEANSNGFCQSGEVFCEVYASGLSSA